MSHRYTLTLGDKSRETLDWLTEENETSKAEILREGLALRGFLQEVTDEGKRLAVINEDGEVEQEVIFLKSEKMSG